MIVTIMTIAKNRKRATTTADTKAEVARETLVSIGAAGAIAGL